MKPIALIIFFLITIIINGCGTIYNGKKNPKVALFLGPKGAVSVQPIKLFVSHEDYTVFLNGEKYENILKNENIQALAEVHGTLENYYEKVNNRKPYLENIDNYHRDLVLVNAKKKRIELTIEKEGYHSKNFIIKKEFNPFFLLNFLNFYGFIIDLGTGTHKRIENGCFKIDLIKDEDHEFWHKKEVAEVKEVEETIASDTLPKNEKENLTVLNDDNDEDLEFLKNYSVSVKETNPLITQKTMLSRQALYHSISVSDSQNLIAYARPDQIMEIRSLNTGKSLFIANDKKIDKVMFSNNGKYLACLTQWNNSIVKNEKHIVRVLDMNTKQWIWESSKILSKNENFSEINEFSFSPSGESISLLNDYNLIVLDVDSGYVKKEFDIDKFNKFNFPATYFFMEELVDVKMLNDAEIQIIATSSYTRFKPLQMIANYFLPLFDDSPDKKEVLAKINVSLVPENNLNKKGFKKVAKQIEGFEIPTYIPHNTFSKGDYIFSYFAHTKQLGIKNMKKDLDPTFIDFPMALRDIEIDSNQIIYYCLENNSTVYRYDLKNKKQLSTIEGHVAPVSDIELNLTKNMLITSDVNGIKMFWNINAEPLFTLYSEENDDFFIINPENYYYCSKNTLQNVRLLNSFGKLYQFESFDLKYNRPDKVLLSMSCSDSSLVDNFKKAAEMRNTMISNFSYNQQFSYSSPEVEIDKTKLRLKTRYRKLNLEIAATDSLADIEYIVVLINGVHQEFVKIEPGLNEIVKRVSVNLSAGENYISTYAINSYGNTSLHDSYTINCTSKNRGKIYFVGLGVSNYEDENYNLTYADKDIKDLSKAFKKSLNKYSLVTNILMNEKVTKNNLKSLKDKLKKVNEDDVIIVSMSGHGLLSDDYSFYFAGYDTDFNSPEKNGISILEIEKLLNATKSRNKLILIDACHSGDIGIEEKNTIDTTQSLLAENIKEVQYRGARRVQQNNSADSFSPFKLMKQNFSDLTYLDGTHIIAAAGGFEYALESDEWSNGVFTYALIDGLFNKKADLDKDDKITVNELRAYVYENVTKLTGGKQVPTARSENVRNNFVILN